MIATCTIRSQDSFGLTNLGNKQGLIDGDDEGLAEGKEDIEGYDEGLAEGKEVGLVNRDDEGTFVGIRDTVGLADERMVICEGAAEVVGVIEGCSSFTNSISVSSGNVHIRLFPAEI